MLWQDSPTKDDLSFYTRLTNSETGKTATNLILMNVWLQLLWEKTVQIVFLATRYWSTDLVEIQWNNLDFYTALTPSIKSYNSSLMQLRHKGLRGYPKNPDHFSILFFLSLCRFSSKQTTFTLFVCLSYLDKVSRLKSFGAKTNQKIQITYEILWRNLKYSLKITF